MWREGEGKSRQPAKTPAFAGILVAGRDAWRSVTGKKAQAQA